MIDGETYRNILGHYPTGVTLVTADDDGPTSMVIGSFSSVSLDPPLVQFMPAKTSTTWPRIERAGSYCVNVLGDDQLELCNSFFVPDHDPWESLEWRQGKTGSPIVSGCLAWMDCVIDNVVDAGDHWIVLGKVVEMDVGDSDRGPLVFFKGSYGGFDAFAAKDELG